MAGKQRVFDVVIVGGGPAGLSAALMLGRACRSVAVVDAGSPRNAASREFHGYLGRDGSDPKALLSDGRRELSRYDVQVLEDSAVRAEKLHDGQLPTAFVTTTRSGRMLKSRKLIFATGVADDVPDLPGVQECYGATIHHCPFCDGWEHRGKRLLAYGTTSAGAVGLGISLRTWSDNVVALTDGCRPARSELELAAANEIELRDRPVRRILHSDDRLEGIEFDDGSTLAADAMFFNSRTRPANELPRMLGCEIGDDDTARVHDKQETNVPGVYIAGDVAGDVSFVIVAAAEGARAAVAINRELQEERRSIQVPERERT